MSRTFGIVGAGIGGLAAAARLAHRGHKVIVFEGTDQVGGRNRRVRVGAAEFDGGPTLLMMRDPFEKLYRDLGESMTKRLDVRLLDPSYRVFYSDGYRLDGTPNVARMISQIEQMGAPKDAAAYLKFLGDLAALYHDAIPNFVRRNYRSPIELGSPKALGIVLRHGMLGNLARRVERTFEDERLRMLFSFQTMYLGLSPFDAPWVYGTLTYMEYGEGIWYPMGGMVRLADDLAAMACERGADFRLGAKVDRIEGKEIVLATGERVKVDTVICNADLPYAEKELLKEPSKPKRRYSCSAFMIYVDYAGELPELEHHNVFFGADFRGNLDDIFHRARMPEDPAFYVCVSSHTDSTRAAPGHHNLFVLVPCPNLDHPFSSEDEQRLIDVVFSRLERETSFSRSHVAAQATYTPHDWAGDLNLDRGAAFGLSHDFWQSACFRPSNRSRSNPDVYYVGASTTPGNGLPMVLISAELVEERLVRDGRL